MNESTNPKHTQTRDPNPLIAEFNLQPQTGPLPARFLEPSYQHTSDTLNNLEDCQETQTTAGGKQPSMSEMDLDDSSNLDINHIHPNNTPDL